MYAKVHSGFIKLTNAASYDGAHYHNGWFGGLQIASKTHRWLVTVRLEVSATTLQLHCSSVTIATIWAASSECHAMSADAVGSRDDKLSSL